jgi:hypothetical protein
MYVFEDVLAKMVFIFFYSRAKGAYVEIYVCDSVINLAIGKSDEMRRFEIEEAISKSFGHVFVTEIRATKLRKKIVWKLGA